MASELTVGRIEELNREHGNQRLKLPSVNGYVVVGDVLKELREAKAEIARLQAAARPGVSWAGAFAIVGGAFAVALFLLGISGELEACIKAWKKTR